MDRYQSLKDVLAEAVTQASQGKGSERHDPNGEAFEDQQIVQFGEWMGSNHFNVGQACKKSIESCRLPPDRARKELLGAINYLAAAVLVLDRKEGGVPFAFAESVARDGRITIQLKGNRLVEAGELLTLEDFVVHGADAPPQPHEEDCPDPSDDSHVTCPEEEDEDPEHYSEVHADGKRVVAKKGEHGYTVEVDGRVVLGALGKDAWKRTLLFMNNRKRREQERADYKTKTSKRREPDLCKCRYPHSGGHNGDHCLNCSKELR